MKTFWSSILCSSILLGLMACGSKQTERVRDPRQYVNVSQVYITYKDNPHAPPDVRRTKEEARLLVEKLHEDIISGKLTFEEAAKQHSDDPSSKERGGYIGPLRKGYGPEEIEEAVFALAKPGDVSPVISTKYAFFIFRREPSEYRGFLHILLTHRHSQRVPMGITRTKEEAKALAQELREKIIQGESMENLARKFSDGMEKKRGGYLPAWNKKAFIEPLQVAWDLDVGEVSPILESPFGFHLIQRVNPLPEVIGLKHILVSYTGAIRAPLTLARTKDEAREKALNLRKAIQTPEDFDRIARKESDDKSTRKEGGDLGLVSWDEMPFEVEDVAFRMPVGSISEVIESPGGFHILYRYE